MNKLLCTMILSVAFSVQVFCMGKFTPEQQRAIKEEVKRELDGNTLSRIEERDAHMGKAARNVAAACGSGVVGVGVAFLISKFLPGAKKLGLDVSLGIASTLTTYSLASDSQIGADLRRMAAIAPVIGGFGALIGNKDALEFIKKHGQMGAGTYAEAALGDKSNVALATFVAAGAMLGYTCIREYYFEALDFGAFQAHKLYKQVKEYIQKERAKMA